MFSRCPALCIDADTTALRREASRPEPVHRATRAPGFDGR